MTTQDDQPKPPDLPYQPPDPKTDGVGFLHSAHYCLMHLPPGGPIDPAWAILFGGLRCATLTSDDGVPLPGMVVSLEDIETMANTFDDLLVKYGKRKAPLWTPN